MDYEFNLETTNNIDYNNNIKNFIEENKMHFTEEQRKELLMKALGL